MAQLVYSEEELLSEHAYAKKHAIRGRGFHGGFDAADNYICPRTLGRVRAVEAWTEALKARGGELLETGNALLGGSRPTNVDQQVLLIRQGLAQVFWDTLSNTGRIEGQGRMLITTPFPNLQDIIVEDISEMALGHLNAGMLKAHGMDESQDPNSDAKGHEEIWYMVRDLVFGEGAYPIPEPRRGPGRDSDERRMPDIPQEHEGLLGFLVSLLLIEYRAEILFSDTQAILAHDDLFEVPKADRELASELVQRIRADEQIHVRSLQLYLGEFRTINVRTVDGGVKPGHEIIDPVWQRSVAWSTEQQPVLQKEFQRARIAELVSARKLDERLLEEYDALADAA